MEEINASRVLIQRPGCEQKKPEENRSAISLRSRFFREFFDTSEDAILILEGDCFIYFNKATIRMMRYSSEEDVQLRSPWEMSPKYQPDGRLSVEKAREMIEIAYEKGNSNTECN